MIRNYIVTIFRNFLRNRNYALINILGLSMGISSCIILFLLITYDLGFDKFHSKHKSIYRVVRDVKTGEGIHHETITPYPFGNAFRQDFPDIPLVTQFHYQDEGVVTIGTDKQQIESILFADTLFFDVFDFGVVSGNPSHDLGEPNKAFITESLGAKLNIGQGDKIKLDNKLELEIVGMLKDVPATSHIQYAMIVSLPSFTKEFFGWPVDRWGLNSAGFSYLVLPENVVAADLTERFKPFVEKYYDKEETDRNTYLIQPLDEIHFNTQYTSTPSPVSNIDTTTLWVMTILGLFILIIACINFINLATALAVKKSREIGIRKTLGAKRLQLTTYFLSETLILTLIAVLISLASVEGILPWLRTFIEKEIYLDLFSNPSLIVFLIVLIVGATLFSGFYPAIILSGFDPVAVLKNKINAKGSSGSMVRRMLVIFQFVIAQVLIIGTLVVTDQMKFFHSKSLGFAPDAVVNVSLPKNDKDILANFRSRLEANPGIKNVSFSVGAPTSDANIGTGFFLTEKGPEENYSVSIKTVDVHYRDTYGIKLKTGRWFTESEAKTAADTTLKNDQRYNLVINEAAAKTLGFASAEDAIDKRIHIGVNDITASVIGVTEDFHTSSLHKKIDPVVMIIFPELYFDAGISIKTEDMQQNIEFIRKTWTELFPEYYFDYEFLNDHLEKLYRSEQRQLVLFRIFSGISIFIGCLGLLGLVSFMANQKVKEIGVRKVFGASVPGILSIFSKEFATLVFFAFLLATPLSWYLMNQWLQNFQYHVSIHWSVFAIGLLVTTVIALGTVAYRAIRASLSNPIESLRSE